jgi:DNA polymerase-3 subunit delta'
LAWEFAKCLANGNKKLDFFQKEEAKMLMNMIQIAPESENKHGAEKEKNISIEEIREAQKELALFPGAGMRRVLVVEKAERMTPAAQNALLKTLEEPNPTSVIILVSNDKSKILPTIKSRCQKINFFLVDNAEMLENFPGANCEQLVSFAAGRPGIAVYLKNNRDAFEERMDLYAKAEKVFSESINKKLDLADYLSKDENKLNLALEFLTWLLREKMLLGNIGKDSLQNISGRLESIENSRELMKNTNVNRRLALENLFLSF